MENKGTPPKRANFTNFSKSMERVSTDKARNVRRSRYGSADYTVEVVKDILARGVASDMEKMSLHFYRMNGIYTHSINYLSTLLLYDTIVTPRRKIDARIAKSTMKKKFQSALEFLERLDVPVTLTHVTKIMLIHGVYYGLLRDFGSDGIVLQDLDHAYCRSNYRGASGLDILEFDLSYFDKTFLATDMAKHKAIDEFPEEFGIARTLYQQGGPRWFEVPEELGVVFYDLDKTPYLISSIPACVMYDEAQMDERRRDKQEMEKLLILQMPISTSTNEPIFDLDETVAIHEGVARMLSNADYINVLTTFGEAKFEDALDATQASRDKLKQYKRAAYDAIGSSGSLFNAEGNIALEYSVNRDISVMLQFTNKYVRWLSYQINKRYGNTQLSFNVEILPTTIYNKQKMAALYLNGAQYGFSKMYAAAALGIKQSNLVGLVEFENDILDLTTKLVPLQSSHTQNGEKSDAKSVEKSDGGDSSNEGGGRPAKSPEERDDKTIKNQNAGSGGQNG